MQSIDMEQPEFDALIKKLRYAVSDNTPSQILGLLDEQLKEHNLEIIVCNVPIDGIWWYIDKRTKEAPPQ